MKYKALLTDIDGTIVNNGAHEKVPSERVLFALRKASTLVSVNFVTGRSLRDVQEIFQLVNIAGIAVVNGGAKIIDTKTGEVLRQYLISPDTIRHVGQLLEEIGVSCNVRTDEKTIPFKEWTKKLQGNDMTVKAIPYENATQAIDLLSSIPTINTYLINSYRDNLFDIHITNSNATKQAGVSTIIEKLSIQPHEVIGVGDGYNDFPLLMACGLKVAMGNAVAELKAIADYIAPSVAEDGVAEVIERFVLASHLR